MQTFGWQKRKTGKMLFAWQKNWLSKFLWCAAHVFLYFTSWKSSVFRRRRQVTCETFISKVFWKPCGKNNMSGCIWHKLFIQTVKGSFLHHIIVCQSFYGALLLLSYFWLQGKILCFARVGKSLARCLFSKCSRTSKKIISPVILDTNSLFKQ